MQEFQKAERRKKPSPSYLFTDVYEDVPPRLQKQAEEMKQHVEKYREHYPDNFEDWKWGGFFFFLYNKELVLQNE